MYISGAKNILLKNGIINYTYKYQFFTLQKFSLSNLNKIFNLNSLNSKRLDTFRYFSATKESYFKKIVSKIRSEVNCDKDLYNDILSLKNTSRSKIYSMNKYNLKNCCNLSLNKVEIKSLNKFCVFAKKIYSNYLVDYFDIFAKNYIYRLSEIIKYLFRDETNQKILEKSLFNWRKSIVDELHTKERKIQFEDSHLNVQPIKFKNDNFLNKKSLILSNETLWDKFGTIIKDMPLLKDFFENPIVERILKKSEISRVLQEMKKIDPKFKLSEFIFLVESLILPHYINAYLSGNKKILKLHSGNKCFKTLYSSIKEIEQLGLKFSPKIIFLGDVELKGVKISEVDLEYFDFKELNKSRLQPNFIFTFNTQQINCFKDINDKVVSGSENDVIQVTYSVAITPHIFKNNKELNYPYMITELAIIGTSPTW